MTSRCSRRRRYTTCKKKRSCKWVKRGKSHKGYCKKRTKRRRQRGGTRALTPGVWNTNQAPPHDPIPRTKLAPAPTGSGQPNFDSLYGSHQDMR